MRISFIKIAYSTKTSKYCNYQQIWAIFDLNGVLLRRDSHFLLYLNMQETPFCKPIIQ